MTVIIVVVVVVVAVVSIVVVAAAAAAATVVIVVVVSIVVVSGLMDLILTLIFTIVPVPHGFDHICYRGSPCSAANAVALGRVRV